MKIFNLLLQQESVNVNSKDKNGFTCLMSACQNGQFELVEVLLRRNANHSVKNNDGWTALILACQEGHDDIVELMLKEAANVNVQTNNGGTALTIAAEHGHLKIVNLLLKNHANPNLCNKLKWSAMMFASSNGHHRVIELLLKERADCNIQNHEGGTALMLACQNGHTKVVEVLYKYTELNICSENGSTALILASDNGDVEIVRILLTANAEVNIQNKNGWTALMFASRKGHYQVVEQLLLNHANPNICTDKGVDALVTAVENNHYQIVQLLLNYVDVTKLTILLKISQKNNVEMVDALLKRKIDPNVQAENGDTALMIAARNGYYQVVELLVKSSAHLNIQNNEGWTALTWASLNGHSEIVELLLKDSDGLVNVQNNDGWTALMIAARNSHYKVVEQLINNHADVNIQTNNGVTALMIAASTNNGQIQIAELLLKNKANPNLKHISTKQTAYTMAVQKGYPEMVQLLLEYGADTHVANIDGDTALHLVVLAMVVSENREIKVAEELKKAFPGNLEDYVRIFNLLLLQGINPNAQSNDGTTCLMVACRYCQLTVIESLLEKGSDPTVPDKAGQTAFTIARKTKPEVMQLLLHHCVTTGQFDLQREYLTLQDTQTPQDKTSLLQTLRENKNIISGLHKDNDVNLNLNLMMYEKIQSEKSYNISQHQDTHAQTVQKYNLSSNFSCMYIS